MQRQSFYFPNTLQEALGLLAEKRGRLIAGGTDVIPQMRDGRFQSEGMIDATHLTELRFIEADNGSIQIGSLTTYNDILQSPLLQAEATALVQAARLIGSPQTRNRGTLGGNIGNASPAGDTLPPLLVMNAIVHLVAAGGEREIRLEDFLLGPGHTAIEAGELIHHVSFKRLPAGTTTVFQRLGNRAGMAVSIASTAVALRLGEDKDVIDVRVALGAVAPTAIRSYQTEAVLMNQIVSEALIHDAARAAAQECSPIDDVRASAAYRRHVVERLVRRVLLSYLDKV